MVFIVVSVNSKRRKTTTKKKKKKKKNKKMLKVNIYKLYWSKCLI